MSPGQSFSKHGPPEVFRHNHLHLNIPTLLSQTPELLGQTHHGPGICIVTRRTGAFYSQKTREPGFSRGMAEKS